MVTTIARPSLPKVPPLPGGVRDIDIPAVEVGKPEPETDEFGLSLAVYGDYPREQRRLVARFISEVGGSKRTRPPFGATIAEAVMLGLFLENGFTLTNAPTVNEHQVRFQSYELGGRQPGGAVTDAYCVYNGTRIAVRVQSVYHDLRDPFGGGGQIQARELRLRQELLASRYIDTVVDVNLPPERALETSPSPIRVHREMDRVLGRAI